MYTQQGKYCFGDRMGERERERNCENCQNRRPADEKKIRTLKE